MQFSARVAGEKNWGTYPFFESAFIGGAAFRLPLDVTGASTGKSATRLRPEPVRRRFVVVGNTELDVAVGKFNAALPFRWD